jgi:hypothetical protein
MIYDCVCKYALKATRNIFYVLSSDEIYCAFNVCSIMCLFGFFLFHDFIFFCS